MPHAGEELFYFTNYEFSSLYFFSFCDILKIGAKFRLVWVKKGGLARNCLPKAAEPCSTCRYFYTVLQARFLLWSDFRLKANDGEPQNTDATLIVPDLMRIAIVGVKQ
jgi:hypothetical protein